MTDEIFPASENLPWPDKNDKLFTFADDSWHNACLNYIGDSWSFYILGYKRAGDILVEYIKETRSDQDFLVYPIVFVYRQYLELSLKWLVQTANTLQGLETNFSKTHRLDELWRVFRKLLPEIEPTTKVEDLESIDVAINQFCAVDPTSESFRYPVTKRGDKTVPDILYINLRQLGDSMQKLASYFDSASDMLSVYLDYKSDMDDYYRDDIF